MSLNFGYGPRSRFTIHTKEVERGNRNNIFILLIQYFSQLEGVKRMPVVAYA